MPRFDCRKSNPTMVSQWFRAEVPTSIPHAAEPFRDITSRSGVHGPWAEFRSGGGDDDLWELRLTSAEAALRRRMNK